MTRVTAIQDGETAYPVTPHRHSRDVTRLQETSMITTTSFKRLQCKNKHRRNICVSVTSFTSADLLWTHFVWLVQAPASPFRRSPRIRTVFGLLLHCMKKSYISGETTPVLKNRANKYTALLAPTQKDQPLVEEAAAPFQQTLSGLGTIDNLVTGTDGTRN